MVKIYVDGSCKGNPGGPGGWGVFAVFDNGDSEELSGADKSTTNNRMEMYAAIEGIKKYIQEENIHIYTDSKYLDNGINLWLKDWKKNNWKTSTKSDVKNKDLWMILDQLNSSHNQISWHWVKGHSGDYGNERADKLAKAASNSI